MIKTRQSVVVTNQETVITHTNGAFQPPPDYSNLTDTEELYTRLANNDLGSSVYNVDNDEYITEPGDLDANDDIAQLHAQLKPTDVELLYARLPTDIIPDTNGQEGLNEDQQQLRARFNDE